jgi:hypothetical protein
MNKLAILRFRITEFLRDIRTNVVAGLVILFFVLLFLDFTNTADRCLEVEVVNILTQESDTGTKLMAVFYVKGGSRIVRVPSLTKIGDRISVYEVTNWLSGWKFFRYSYNQICNESKSSG